MPFGNNSTVTAILTFADGITPPRLDMIGDGKVGDQMKIKGDVTGDSGDWVL